MNAPPSTASATAFSWLSAADACVLAERAVAPQVAGARGYASVTADQATAYGFAGAQARAGLLIPRFNTQRVNDDHQLRPHDPRLDDGRPRKYEWPVDSRPAIDVHPSAQHLLDQIDVPLIVTESILKADAILSAASPGTICPISVSGVWGWCKDGVPLPDFRDVKACEKERRRVARRRVVMIAFDSDAATNPKVRRARAELALFLRRKGADVRVLDVPGGPNGAKAGIDDALAAGHRLADLIASAHEPTKADLSVVSVTRSPEVWDPPVGLEDVPRPPFPVDVLSGWQRRFVEELARETQTPEDLAAMQTMDVVALAVAKKVVVQVRDGWIEPLNRYSVTALPSGERKSPVHLKAIKPVEDYEKARARDDADRIAGEKSAYRIGEKTLERAEKEAADAKPGERHGKVEVAKEAAKELQKMTVSVPTCLLADDITPEKIALVLAEQSGRLAIVTDEGGIFDLMAGRYAGNGVPNFDVYLKAHAGGTVRVKRIGRPDDFVPRPRSPSDSRSSRP